jgi:CHAD domain-containing protein
MALRRPFVKEESAIAYGRREVAACARRLIEWARRAPKGRPDEEYIHELRVRLRRARAAMRAFRRFYDSPAVFERRVAPLRRLSRALGPMRDADVTAALFDEVLRTVPYAPRSVSRALVAHHRAQEARWGRVKSALAGVCHLTPTVLSPPIAEAGEEGGRGLAKHARKTLRRKLNDVGALAPAVITGNPPDLHALRIEIKRLRYTVETFDALLGADGRLWGAKLREMQSTLGLVQDHTVALVQVEGFLAKAREPLERASLELVGRIIEGRRAAHIERFRWQWRTIDPRRFEAVLSRK